MDIHDAALEALEERPTKEVHVPRADHELDSVTLEPVRHRAVAGIAIVVVTEWEELRCDARSRSSLESAYARLVRRDSDDRKAGIEERLEIRALAADQDPDHERTMVPITSASPGSGTTAT
jgi:hypothetical protein